MRQTCSVDTGTKPNCFIRNANNDQFKGTNNVEHLRDCEITVTFLFHVLYLALDLCLAHHQQLRGLDYAECRLQ